MFIDRSKYCISNIEIVNMATSGNASVAAPGVDTTAETESIYIEEINKTPVEHQYNGEITLYSEQNIDVLTENTFSTFCVAILFTIMFVAGILLEKQLFKRM